MNMDDITPSDASILALIAYESRAESPVRAKPELVDRLESDTARRIAEALTGQGTGGEDSKAAESLLRWAREHR